MKTLFPQRRNKTPQSFLLTGIFSFPNKVSRGLRANPLQVILFAFSIINIFYRHFVFQIHRFPHHPNVCVYFVSFKKVLWSCSISTKWNIFIVLLKLIFYVTCMHNQWFLSEFTNWTHNTKISFERFLIPLKFLNISCSLTFIVLPTTPFLEDLHVQVISYNLKSWSRWCVLSGSFTLLVSMVPYFSTE